MVQMHDRPGELAHLARALAMRGISIGHIVRVSHIASAGAGEVACAFISTEDEDATREVVSLMSGPGCRRVGAMPGEHRVFPL